jgi:hypothetical protein
MKSLLIQVVHLIKQMHFERKNNRIMARVQKTDIHLSKGLSNWTAINYAQIYRCVQPTEFNFITNFSEIFEILRAIIPF